MTQKFSQIELQIAGYINKSILYRIISMLIFILYFIKHFAPVI